MNTARDNTTTAKHIVNETYAYKSTAHTHWDDRNTTKKIKINFEQNDNERETNENDRINDLSFNNNHKFRNNLGTQNDTISENHMRWSWSVLLSDLCSLYVLFVVVRVSPFVACLRTRCCFHLCYLASMPDTDDTMSFVDDDNGIGLM